MKPLAPLASQMVSFSVPNVDRCTTDMQRIPGEVVSVS